MTRRMLSFLLALTMVLTMLPMPAMAAGACTHHTEHTADCGYAAAVEEKPCTFVHEGCGCAPAVAEKPCQHVHDAACGYSEGTAEVPCTCVDADGDGAADHGADCTYVPAVAGTPCTHSHDDSCGYAPAKAAVSCGHVHDSTCGWAEAVGEQACSFVCTVCNPPQEPEVPESSAPPVCSCDVRCNEMVNNDCPVCVADQSACEGGEPADDTPSEAVLAVQGLIDALPALEAVQAMTLEEQGKVYEQTQAAYSAYEALTDEEKPLVTGTEIFETLFTYFNSLVMTTPEEEYVAEFTVNEQTQRFTDIDDAFRLLNATVQANTLTLLADATSDQNVSFKKNVTIDMNGKALTLGGMFNDIDASLTITGGGTINGNFDLGGTLNGEGTTFEGTITVQNGTITGGTFAGVFIEPVYGSTELAKITGGTFGNTLIVSGNCIIEGGNFSGVGTSGDGALTINGGNFEEKPDTSYHNITIAPGEELVQNAAGKWVLAPVSGPFIVTKDGVAATTGYSWDGNKLTITEGGLTVSMKEGPANAWIYAFADSLTLNGVNITDNGSFGTLCANGSLSLTIHGSNTLKSSASEAISADGSLTIDGSGSLDATAGGEEQLDGIIAGGRITIKSGTVKATGANYYGISGGSGITIDGGNVDADLSGTSTDNQINGGNFKIKHENAAIPDTHMWKYTEGAAYPWSVVAKTYTLTVTDLTFDPVNVGDQPGAKAITIKNTGNSDATIKSVTLSGDHGDSFTLTGSDTTVPAGGTLETYKIQPVAGLAKGTYTATVTVTYNGDATAAAKVSVTVTCDHSGNQSEDDGNCMTPIICSVCKDIVTPGNASHSFDNDCDTDCNNAGCSYTRPITHQPEADDGSCTTDILCSVCKAVVTKGNKDHSFDNDCDTDCNSAGCKFTRPITHQPEADDGDCTTAIHCAVCDAETTAARPAHTGGTATCTEQAKCDVCGRGYGELAEHTPDEDDGDCTTAILCSVCKAETTAAKTSHTGGTATCAEKAKCEVCGREYGELAAHTPKADDGDCTTAIHCAVCGAETTAARPYHTGGKATCTEQAKCEVCGKGYGELAAHTPNEDDGDCTTARNCAVCQQTAIPGNASHSFDNDCDTDCNSAGCSYTREPTHSNFTWTQTNVSGLTGVCGVCQETMTATISADDAVYDGKVHETARVEYSDNWTQGDLTVTYDPQNPTNAGSVTASIQMGDATAGISYNITPKPLTVTADDQTKVYGAADPVLTYVAEGLLGNDKLSGESARAAGENVGEYAITRGTLSAGDNYELTFTEGTFTITAASIENAVVTVEGGPFVYNGQEHRPAVTVKLGDQVLNGRTRALPDYTLTYENNVNAGTATVTVTGTGNYTGTATAEFVIEKAKPTVMIPVPEPMTYGTKLGDVDLPADWTWVEPDTMPTVADSVFDAWFTVDDENYDWTGEESYDAENHRIRWPIGVIVNPAKLTITADNKTVEAEEPMPELTYTVEGLLAGEKLTKQPKLSCDADLTKVGEYEITASGAEASENYAIVYVSGKLTVTARTRFTVTFNSQGGSAVAAQTVKAEEMAVKPTAPTRDDHNFKGWYTDEKCTTAYDFKTPVTGDITLYAKWAQLYDHALYFKANAGKDEYSNMPSNRFDETESQTHEFRIPLFTWPRRSGYSFVGWNTQADGKGTKYWPGGKIQVEESQTLYAQWQKIDFTNPKTGDYIMMAVAGMVLSGAALAGVLVYSKKKKNKK